MNQKDSRRFFTKRQRRIAYLNHEGRCADCNDYLTKGFHMHHLRRWADGGQTEQANGSPLCESCHKKVTAMNLRAWQQEALMKYNESTSQVFFLQACPGAGKTKFTLTALQNEMEKRGKTKTFIIVVAPSDSLKNSWMLEAHDFGIELNTRASDVFPRSPDWQGVVITYQSLGRFLPLVKQWHRQADFKFILVCDEVHHTSESNSWGSDSLEYGELCDKIIFLSGTPNRTDKYKIPLANYENDLLVVDYKYGYTRALIERVCRKAEVKLQAFNPIQQNLETGELFSYDSASLDESQESSVLRKALNTGHKLVREMIAMAWESVSEMRIKGDSNAACLVRCLTSEKAGAEDGHINQVVRLIKQITGLTDQDIEVVHSGIDESTDKIAKFRKNNKVFLVSIRQISEGVDIPRLRVLLHLDNTTAELTLRQELGRVTRWESEHDNNQHAIVIMPDIPTYKEFAIRIEEDVLESTRAFEEIDTVERSKSDAKESNIVTLSSDPTGVSIVMSGEVHSDNDSLIKTAQAMKKLSSVGDVPLEMLAVFAQAYSKVIANNYDADDEFSKEKLAALNEMPMVKSIPNDELSKEIRLQLNREVNRVLNTSKIFEKHKDVWNKIYELYPLKMPDNSKSKPIEYVERKYGIDGLKRLLKICRELVAVKS